MTWVTLADALNSATAKGFDVGEMAAATASQPKRTRTEARAKFQEVLPGTPGDSLPAKEVHANRWEYTAAKAGAPHSEAVYCHLVVIEGSGGRREGGSGVRRLRRNASEERQRELGLRVIVGRAGARVAGTVPAHSSPSGAGAIPMADR